MEQLIILTHVRNILAEIATSVSELSPIAEKLRTFAKRALTVVPARFDNHCNAILPIPSGSVIEKTPDARQSGHP